MSIDYSGLPLGLQGGTRRYIEQGVPPGGFLKAVLCNDLFGALARADGSNLYQLLEISRWFYNYAPPGCHGSKENYRDWLEKNCCNKKSP